MRPFADLPRKLLFVITGLAYGGAETQVMHLAIRLNARGWDVQVVSVMPPLAYTEELNKAGVPVISLGVRRKWPNPKPFFYLIRIIRRWQPQIVHSHMVHANILARLVRPFAPIPVLICTAHSIDERGRKGSGRLRTFLYRTTDPLCDLTTQVSEAGLERYVRIRAVPMHKIRYIPNGVDIVRFSPNPEIRVKVRNAFGFGDEFIWLAVGRLEPAKEYPAMLYAFAQILKRFPLSRLLIVGEGSLRPSIEALAKKLGIRESVHFLGLRSDVPDLMRGADAYVMSSAWEGMPMVLLEAHASGLPIVTTNVGGNGEIVIDGKTGFLVSPKDPDALASGMLRLMELTEEERKRMGQEGRKHVVEKFGLEQVVEMWEDLYCELLIRKRVRSDDGRVNV